MLDAAAVLTGVGAAALTAGAATGAGAAVLAALGLMAGMARLEAATWAFAVGFGVVGWVLFFLALVGWIAPITLAALSIIALGGTPLLLRAKPSAAEAAARDFTWWILMATLIAVLSVDLLEGIAPPADADSLAYHFALPKQFLAAGQLEFVPRAVDGAIPLLVQMTYLIPLALGGETGLTLWTMASGWMAGLLVYVVACRYMTRNWAMTSALLFISVPAMLYSGGTGHVEPRVALFATIAAVAMADAVVRQDLRLVALAGLAVGCFAAAKYTGLLFAAACALPLFIRWRSIRAFAVYGIVICIAGSQWYFWNWSHTGDPLFPVLWRVLDLPDSAIWTSAQDAVFHERYFQGENPYPQTVAWLFVYPFAVTLMPAPTIDAGRVGLGPFPLLALPFVAAALWRFRRRLFSHPLFTLGLVCAGFYILWFLTGSSQRVRHLIPVFPLFLICLTGAAEKFGRTAGLMRPVAGTAVAALFVHLSAQAAFGINYVRYLTSNEKRSGFLARNVAHFDLVEPVQSAMEPGDRVLVPFRELVYLFDRPTFYYHPVDQAQVTPRIATDRPDTFLKQIRAQSVTLILVPTPRDGNEAGGMTGAVGVLARYGCAEPIRHFKVRKFRSRTLRALGGETPHRIAISLYRVKTSECRL